MVNPKLLSSHSNSARSGLSNVNHASLHSSNNTSSIGYAQHPPRHLRHGDGMLHFQIVLHLRFDVASRDTFDLLGFGLFLDKPQTIPAEESLLPRLESSGLHGLETGRSRVSTRHSAACTCRIALLERHLLLSMAMESAPSSPEGGTRSPVERPAVEEEFYEVADAEGASELPVPSTPSRKRRTLGRSATSLDQCELDEHILMMDDEQHPPLSPKEWMKSIARQTRSRSGPAVARRRNDEDGNNEPDASSMRADVEDIEVSKNETESEANDMKSLKSPASRAGEGDTDRELSTWEKTGSKVDIAEDGYYKLLEKEVNKPYEEIVTYLFEDTSESCFFRKWHRARGTANLNVSPWKEFRDCKTRSATYRAFGKDPILRNGFEIVEEWFLRNVEGIGYIVDVDISTPFLPYGKNYMVRESFCLVPVNERQAHVKVASTVIFLKSTMSFIQGKILKNAKMGSERSSKKLSETLDEEEQLTKPMLSSKTRLLPGSLSELDLTEFDEILDKWVGQTESSTVRLIFIWLFLSVGFFLCLLKTQLDGMGSFVSTLQIDLAFGAAVGRHVLESSFRVFTKPDLPDTLDEFVWALLPTFLLLKLLDKVISFSLSSEPQVSLKLEVMSMADDILPIKIEDVSIHQEPEKRKRGKRTAKFIAQNKRNLEKLHEALIGGAHREGDSDQFYKKEMKSRLPSEPKDCVEKTDGDPSSSAISQDNNEGPVIEEIFENERLQPFVGWGSKYPGHLLPTDRKKWSDRTGKVSSMTFGKVVPPLPKGWRWVSEWTIDRNRIEEKCIDSAGFSYGVDFWQLKYPPLPGSGHNGYSSFVRRRRWIRIRKKIEDGSQSQ